MLLKELKVLFPNGKVRTFKDGNGGQSQRVFYMHPYDLRRNLSDADWKRISDWNGICILSSPKGKPNEAFYFNWGWGGTPEYKIQLTINPTRSY